jgi:acetoin utilization deacetylase AcuC-like enzyme
VGRRVRARHAGHRAEPNRAIASTYLNNLAIGAEHARSRGAQRVAIVDWDVRVGNGAERIFWDRADVLALSLHQRDWYPAHADDHVRDAVAAVRRAQPRWFS